MNTPLTLVMQLAEREAVEKAPAAWDPLREYTTILHHRLEREQRRARLAGGAFASQRLVLDDEIPPWSKPSIMLRTDKRGGCNIDRRQRGGSAAADGSTRAICG